MEKNFTQILEKVFDLFSKYGIRSVTMDDVARGVGISKKTLYQYVHDKNQLVEKLIFDKFEEFKTQIILICNSNLNAIEELFEVSQYASEVMSKVTLAFDYDLNKYFPEVYDKFTKAKREYMYQGILNNMRKGKEQDLYRSDFDEIIIAKLYVLRIESKMNNEIFTQEELFSGRVFKEIFIYHLRGIANNKGLEILDKKLNKIKKQEK